MRVACEKREKEIDLTCFKDNPSCCAMYLSSSAFLCASTISPFTCSFSVAAASRRAYLARQLSVLEVQLVCVHVVDPQLPTVRPRAEIESASPPSAASARSR
eukprot:764851-Hanusia_phi.AAC.9